MNMSLHFQTYVAHRWSNFGCHGRGSNPQPLGSQADALNTLAIPPCIEDCVLFGLPCNSLVSFESRYGIWVLFPSTRAEMTLPRADRLRLIFVASFNLSPWPQQHYMYTVWALYTLHTCTVLAPYTLHVWVRVSTIHTLHVLH